MRNFAIPMSFSEETWTSKSKSHSSQASFTIPSTLLGWLTFSTKRNS